MKRSLQSLFLLVLLAGCGGGAGDSGDGGNRFGRQEIFVGDGRHSVNLAWNEPNTREDGSPLGTSFGFEVHYQGDGTDFQSIAVGQVNNVTIRGLADTTYQFSVSTIDGSGTESGRSELVSLSLR